MAAIYLTKKVFLKFPVLQKSGRTFGNITFHFKFPFKAAPNISFELIVPRRSVHRHISQKVPSVEFNVDIRFSTFGFAPVH